MSEEQIASCLLCQSTFSNHEELFVHSCEQIKVETNELEDKVEKVLKGSLDSIPSPSHSVKIQILGGKVCLRCKGKHCWALSTSF